MARMSSEEIRCGSSYEVDADRLQREGLQKAESGGGAESAVAVEGRSEHQTAELDRNQRITGLDDFTGGEDPHSGLRLGVRSRSHLAPWLLLSSIPPLGT
ncbi:hypothetical protein GCM10010149_07470 [Nonomuraea roseoviolacea subsp. roseoviolacea]